MNIFIIIKSSGGLQGGDGNIYNSVNNKNKVKKWHLGFQFGNPLALSWSSILFSN